MSIPRCRYRSNHCVPAIQPPPRRAWRAVAAFLLLLAAADKTWSQTPFIPEGRIDVEQFILPWDGPGAAVFNPVWITETKRVDGRLAFRAASSRKAVEGIFQGSINSPWGIAAGFNSFANASAIDGSNAVYEEAISTMMIAWGGRNFGGLGIDGGVGLAYVTHDYNAFGAVESQAHAWDFGIHASMPARWNLGRLHYGFTFRNFAAEEMKLPSDNPAQGGNGYKTLLPNFDSFFLLKSAFDCFDAYFEINHHRDQDASEGPRGNGPSRIKSMGVEYRPLPYAGLKIERTWLKRWTFGLVGRGAIPIGEGIEVGAEANVSHDKFLSPKDEGRGYIVSLALNAGM